MWAHGPSKIVKVCKISLNKHICNFLIYENLKSSRCINCDFIMFEGNKFKVAITITGQEYFFNELYL